jgi:hypothetical protein
MTVSASVIKTPNYQGNGVTYKWPLSGLQYTDKAQLVGFITNTVTGAVTAVTSDFYVSTSTDEYWYPGYEPGSEPDPSLQPAKLTSTQYMTIARVSTIDQGLDLKTSGNFNADNIEAAFDKAILITQELKEELARTLKAPISATIDYTLPVPVANGVIGFNGAGTAMETKTGIPDLFSAAEVQAAIDHPEATGNPHATTAAQVGAYTDDQVDVLLAGKESALGNPGTDGMALVSTAAGARSWKALYDPGLTLRDCILPEDNGTFGWRVSRTTGLGVRISAGRGILGKKYHDDRNYKDITLPARRAVLIYRLKNAASDSVTPSEGVVEAAFPAVGAQTLRHILDGSTPIANTGSGGANAATKTGTVAPTDGRVGLSGKGNGTDGLYTCASAAGVPAYASPSTRILMVDQFVSNGAAQTFYNDGVTAFGCTAANNLKVNGVDTSYTLENGKPYKFTVAGDGAGTSGEVSVNGAPVYSGAVFTNTAAVAPTYYAGAAGAEKSPSQIAYFEAYASRLTKAQIAAASNALLLPCRYGGGIQLATGGTAIGNLTTNGLAAMFDGNVAKGYTACSNSGASINTAYGGKDWGAGVTKIITGFRVYAPSNYSFSGGIPDTLTVTLQVSADDFSSSVVDVYTLTIADASALIIDVPVLPTPAPAGRSGRVKMVSTATNFMYINQIEFYEDVAASDVRANLPAGAVAVAYARTGATDVLEIDHAYKFGRREGITGGNRIQRLGKKPYSGSSTPEWDSPFDTRKIKACGLWSLDAAGTLESPIPNDGANSYISETVNGKIRITVTTGVNVAGVNKTSGYLEPVVEVLTDD